MQHSSCSSRVSTALLHSCNGNRDHPAWFGLEGPQRVTGAASLLQPCFPG